MICLRAFLFLFIFVLSPSAWGAVVDRVAAIVNREIITQSELDEAKQSLRAQKGRDVLGSEAQAMLTQMIEERLMLQEARKKGVYINDSDLEVALKDIEARNRLEDRQALIDAVSREIPWEKYLDKLRNQLVILKLMHQEAAIDLVVSEEEIRAYYDAQPQRWRLPDSLRLLQIVLTGAMKERDFHRELSGRTALRQRAEEARARALAGEDFRNLVALYSNNPKSDLGFFKRGELSSELEPILFNLKEGEISPVIQTDQGFHIFKVAQRQEGTFKSFELVHKEIETLLLTEKKEAARKKWLEQLWEKGSIEIK